MLLNFPKKIKKIIIIILIKSYTIITIKKATIEISAPNIQKTNINLNYLHISN